MCQPLRAANLRQSKPASAMSSSTSGRASHYSACHDQQQLLLLILKGAAGPKFEVCDGDMFNL
jgi:hypothetical protein